MPRLGVIAAFAILSVSTGACRPLDRRTPRVDPPPTAAQVLQGGYTYALYCAGCHGPRGEGDGPFTATLGLVPKALRSSALVAASDAAVLDRLIRGTPLEVPPLDRQLAEARAVDALADYLPRLASAQWEVLRAGRVVYDDACAGCHGTYGRGDGLFSAWIGAPDLLVARERYTDPALARISEAGIGTMLPLYGFFGPGERRALVAYVRHLSDGFALYDTRCAACHGDDGQGIYSRDVVPPAVAAPALSGPYPRERLLGMLRRESGVMPHFHDLDERRLRDVVAFLRAAIVPHPTPGH
jgi:mono/diheme cytochrome c family protein